MVEQGHVNGILTAVVQGMNSSEDLNIRQSAFECLVAISSTYYDRLDPYMKDILDITARAMEENEEPVALQAIEFWSSICDEEFNRSTAKITCSNFIRKELPVLVRSLVGTLPRQEEDQDQGEWARNIAMARRTCLQLVMRTVGDVLRQDVVILLALGRRT
ncbi:hypothetical protein SLEP1_g58262 [Rubroshorea leprosula]|uniref:Uncharacterized protein n=1 Tax=Rubroshorea leprosula TaxID=152421 RepID=A0AAV5MSD5_9ROSI|nr:hypothetical protein SLEP1_g58262 [Rubroshorea leprosula]